MTNSPIASATQALEAALYECRRIYTANVGTPSAQNAASIIEDKIRALFSRMQEPPAIDVEGLLSELHGSGRRSVATPTPYIERIVRAWAARQGEKK